MSVFCCRSRLLTAGSAALAVMFCACASVGPGTIGRDRLDYDHAVTESWKRQMLLNLVKLRYGDAPMFLDVSSIINSYALEGNLNAGANWESGGGTDSMLLGGSAHFADKPTITYSPMLGEHFVRSLMTPVAPGVVVSLIQSGWGADSVLRVLVSSINGVQNRIGAGGPRARGADADFHRLIEALRRVQTSGAVGMRVERSKGQELTILTIPREDSPNNVAAEARAIRDILGVKPGLAELNVVYGAGRRSDDEVAMITRSMLEVLTDIGASIDVPAAHVEEGRTYKTPVFDTDAPGGHQPLVRIQSGRERPEDSFTAVPYRGHWFWVADRDFRSKSFFSLMLVLMSLSDTGPAKGAPIVTIPAG